MPLCVFDLDHTLIRTPLDLAAMALDIRAFLEGARGPLPPRPERWRVGELIQWSRAHAPELEAEVWAVALAHERDAMARAALEPGAPEALAGARGAGFRTALWTNNARAVSVPALERLGLDRLLDLVVTRDEMRALKPDPDGWRVIAAHFAHGDPDVAPGPPDARHAPAEPARASVAADALVVGDSWVDGVAAAAAGVAFVAYRAREEDLARWGITPVTRLTDLAALPGWLARRRNGSGVR